MIIYSKHLLSAWNTLGAVMNALLGLFYLKLTQASLPVSQMRKPSLETFKIIQVTQPVSGRASSETLKPSPLTTLFWCVGTNSRT